MSSITGISPVTNPSLSGLVNLNTDTINNGNITIGSNTISGVDSVSIYNMTVTGKLVAPELTALTAGNLTAHNLITNLSLGNISLNTEVDNLSLGNITLNTEVDTLQSSTQYLSANASGTFISGNIKIDGNANINANVYLSGNLKVNNDLRLLGNAYLSKHIFITGNVGVDGNLEIGSLNFQPNKKGNLTLNNCTTIGNELLNTAQNVPNFTFTSNSQNGYTTASSSIGRYSYAPYLAFVSGGTGWWSNQNSYNADGSASGTYSLTYGSTNLTSNGDWVSITMPSYYYLTNVSFYNDDGYLLNHTMKSVSIFGQYNSCPLDLLGSISMGGNPPSKGTYNIAITPTPQYYNKFYFQCTACSNWSGGGISFECAVSSIVFTGEFVNDTVSQNIYIPQGIEIGRRITNALITDYHLTVNGDANYNGNIEVNGFLKPSTLGLSFPKDPGGGSGDLAWVKYYPYSGENCVLEIGINNDATDHIYLHPSGGVGIATSTPSYKFHVNGTAGFSGSTYITGQFFASGLGISSGGPPTVVCDTNNSYVMQRVSSSRRYKKNIEDLPDKYNKDYFMKIRPVIYNSAISDSPDFYGGFIAEELEEIGYSLFLHYHDGVVDGVDYARLTVILVKMLQETIKELDVLKNNLNLSN